MSQREQHYYRMGYEPRTSNGGGGGFNEAPMPRMSMEEFAQRRADFDRKYGALETESPFLMTTPRYDHATGRIVSFVIFPETAGRKLLPVIDSPIPLQDINMRRELVSV